jgi:hypothetical protein
MGIAFAWGKLPQLNADENCWHYIRELVPPYEILRIFLVHRGYGGRGTAGSGFVATYDPLINGPPGMPHAVALSLVASVHGVHGSAAKNDGNGPLEDRGVACPAARPQDRQIVSPNPSPPAVRIGQLPGAWQSVLSWVARKLLSVPHASRGYARPSWGARSDL